LEPIESLRSIPFKKYLLPAMVGGAYSYILFGGLLAMTVVVAMGSMMEKIIGQPPYLGKP
jgi:hypothetical protein